MSTDVESIIKDFCKCFCEEVDIVELKYGGKIPVVTLKKSSETLTGFRNIVNRICPVKEAEEAALIEQWIEYAVANFLVSDVSSGNTYYHILAELNTFLADKVYFVGNCQSSADILIYLFLYSLMANLSFQEKEKYLHASRWFNNIQQNSNIRSSRSLVTFSRTRLYT